MSSSKTVKFELSLEKLTVKFEGDVQTAERFQGDISNALNTLASAQNRMIAPARSATTPSTLIEASAGGGSRRRRRRKNSASGGIDPAIIDGVAMPANGDAATAAANGSDAPKRTRRSGTGPSALILGLKADSFFTEKRNIGAIRAALSQRGHSFESNQVSPTLVSLTQQGELRREKNAENQWEYFV